MKEKRAEIPQMELDELLDEIEARPLYPNTPLIKSLRRALGTFSAIYSGTSNVLLRHWIRESEKEIASILKRSSMTHEKETLAVSKRSPRQLPKRILGKPEPSEQTTSTGQMESI